MKKKEKQFLLRLPETLHKELEQIAEQKSISMNSLIKILIDQALHPISSSNDSSESQLTKELQKIDDKIDNLIIKRDELVAQDYLLRQRASINVPDRPDIQKSILELLRIQPLSELRIASELHQDPETIFLLLCHLEKQEKVSLKDMKWYVPK